ncbi:FAD-dependent oxidoreductase [bacterium]|nr:FAD-dependent oxidoreductase [bacterium]
MLPWISMAVGKFPRRSFLAGSLAMPLAIPALASSATKLRVAVIGAGAFGGWTALFLLRNGAQVTVFDAWGPGNARASSGGETRVIRGVYGPNRIYVKWTVRSFQLWKEAEKAWNRKIYTKTNAIWMIRENQNDDYEKAAMPLLEAEGLPYQKLTPSEASKHYPQINFDGVGWVLKEEEAGFLLARQACQCVLDSFIAEGGEYRLLSAKRGPEGALQLSDGSTFQSDAYVFACGPWLSELFPELMVGRLIEPTRQEVFFFGTPAAEDRWTEKKMPVWIDHGERLIYGVPGNERRGFKVADDTRGEPFNPTSGERKITSEKLEAARKFLELRFPDLKNAPLVESRVCQYENSPDQNFIIDQHTQMKNIWIVGGGSGHGFKHGPAVGEYTAGLVLDKQKPDPFFQLDRFRKGHNG